MSHVWRVLIVFFLSMMAPAEAAVQTLPLPVTLNGQDLGEVNARLGDTDLVAVDLRPVRGRLAEVLAPDWFGKLPDPNRVWVSPAQLEAAGVRVRFDFSNLALHLSVPPAERRPETWHLIGTPAVQANRPVPPSEFSAYLNVRGGVDYREGRRFTTSGFAEPQVAFENAFNLRGWVLENETAVNPAPDKPWEKRDTRLVWDQPEHRRRWTLGDLQYPVTGFQGFIPMAGLSLSRENRLQPYRVTSPLGQTAFQLQEDSQVEILVNGHLVQTRQLKAGPHRISDFPLTGGANDVVLRLTDPVGRVEYINATFYYDPGLLKGGETEFNYAVGLPSRPQPDTPAYEYKSAPAASAFYRWGFTDTLTAGFNGQATPDAQQAGAEVVLNTPVGVFAADSAFTRNRGLGLGHAERLQYRYYAPADSVFANAVASLAVRHASDRHGFADPFSFSPPSRGETWDWQGRYSQRLGEHFSAGLAYGEQLQRGATQLRSYSVTGGYRWRQFSADLTLQHQAGPAQAAAWAGFLSVTLNLGRGIQAYARHDTTLHSTRTELQYTPPGNVESFSGMLGVQTTADAQGVYGNGRYFGRRAELLLSQDFQSTGEGRTSLRWGTALVYAGGAFGVSRPVVDSFALVESTGSLHAEGGVGVYPQAGRYAAQESWLGPAVLPELTGYYNTPVRVEPRQPYAEFDPQEGDLLLQPTYRSGTLVRLGHASSANVTLTLLWADGKPAALQTGTVTAANGAPVEFITDREGLAYLHGLPAGPCQGTLDNHPEAPFTLAIPTDKNIDVNLGPVRIPTTE